MSARPIEDRYLAELEAEKRRAKEMHRLRYCYFLNRLREHPDSREIAALCRTERALHLGVSEAEADSTHGTVIEIAKRLGDTP